MQITNCGRGIHKREVSGVERLRAALPSNWYAFTNLDLVLGAGKAREVDLVLISDRRIFVIDLKDWHGRIESVEGRWFLDGSDKDSSPVAKITDIARNTYILLKSSLARRDETKTSAVPKIDGLVVLTGKADRSGIADTEIAKVLTVDEFVDSFRNLGSERATFGNVAEQFLAEPLTSPVWKNRLSKFFNAGNSSPFSPGHRRFQRFVAQDDFTFTHPSGIYREYEAQEDDTPPSLGTLRLWDFSKVSEARFQTEEGRNEIAGRERQVYHWLRDRNVDIERNLLTPRLEDPERGPKYWEIYDRRPRLKRLADFCLTEANRLSTEELLELARQFLAVVAEIHKHSAAHLDLGAHSVWLEAPTSVRFSHLFAARFPSVKSLGNTRFQFLASVRVPEDILGGEGSYQQRDVFLAGVVLHQLFFGAPPPGDPPEWEPGVDKNQRFKLVHDWLSEALDLDASRRFFDGGIALAAFNKATATRPTFDEISRGLERYRTEIKSQFQLAAAYPPDGSVATHSDIGDSWRSASRDGLVLVKVWKSPAWGDLKREGARVLAFLERASSIQADGPSIIPLVRRVLWLGDAFAVVQEWQDGETLERVIADRDPKAAADAIHLVAGLVTAVMTLHDLGMGHGDLKPDNIVITEGHQVVLVDALDFSSSVDGEIHNTKYSAGGDKFARDRYATGKIAEEIFAFADLSPVHLAELARGIEDCRTKEPRLASLLPLDQAIKKVQGELAAPEIQVRSITLSVSLLSASVGTLEPDEGFYYLRAYPASSRGLATIHVRGASEELEFRLDEKSRPIAGRRRTLSQTRISIVARHEVYKFTGSLCVHASDHNDLSAIDAFLSDTIAGPLIAAALAGRAEGRSSEARSDQAEVEGDAAQEKLIEELNAADPAIVDLTIDVPKLWRELINTERELTTEGVALDDSFFDKSAGTHKVPFDLQSGVFDFSRQDTVGVQRQDRKGWRRIGELDIKNSSSSVVVVEPLESGGPRARLIEAGQRLQFVSHFETESLRRRSEAVQRILSGAGRTAELLSVFDPRSKMQPAVRQHDLDYELLKQYDLNADQTAAFQRIISARPIGLLQGPPGTGKTRFIAALAHYSLTKNLARNVLLASQSHEAVNTAGETLLKLFRNSGTVPSVLRVAMNEDHVSEMMKPFHASRVEQALKDKFSAAMRDRVALAGRALGVTDDAIDRVIIIELTIKPIVALISELLSADEPDMSRVAGLRESLGVHLERAGASRSLAEDVGTDAETFVKLLYAALGPNFASARATPDKLSRLRNVINIGRDFVASTSRPLRSFETFLAGTRQIVLGTCVGLGKASLGLTSNAFDLVIVDEAARCTASELLVPLQSARWAVLVGDHAQLQPTHDVEVVKRVSDLTKIPKVEIQRSDFERVFLTDYGKAAGARLHTQYRMLPPIGAIVSDTFYPDLRLEPGRSGPVIPPNVLPASLSHPLTWIDTDSLGEAAFERGVSQTGSRKNPVEANLIVSLLNTWFEHSDFREWAMMQTAAPIPVAVISMYAAQRDAIHHLLLRSPIGMLVGKQVKVGTVDSYQGKENPIVLVSLVRNNAEGSPGVQIPTIRQGFLSSPNRINVAASRAMDRLIIVGARKRWTPGSPMSRLSSAFADRMVTDDARVMLASDLLMNETSTESKKRARK